MRYGYSRERLAEIARTAGLEVRAEAFVSGFASQKLTDLMRRLAERIGLTPAWAVLLPLRPLVLLDRLLSRALGYPYLSVAVCAAKPQRAQARSAPLE